MLELGKKCISTLSVVMKCNMVNNGESGDLLGTAIYTAITKTTDYIIS